MKSTLPALRLALIGLAVASAFGATSANAQTPAQTPAQPGTPSDSARPRGPGAGGPQLFSKEERDSMREKVRAAKTPEEQQKLRGEYRAELERRAKEKGVTLPPQRADGRQGAHGSGHAHGAHGAKDGAGKPGAQAGHGQRGDHPACNLMSDAERQQFRDKMHAAKTPEERKQARSDMRATLEQRAKEKGVTLPEPRGRHGHGGRSHRGGSQGTSQS